MSAQQRYLTLVQHISKIYSADDGGIDELTDGLKDILTRINPAAAADWKKVQVDSKRLLRVWHSRADDDDAAADEVVDQIAESLKEFSMGDIQHVAPVEAPTLVVSEVAASAPIYKTVTVTAATEEEEDDEEEEEEEEAPVVVVVKKAAESDHDGDIKMLIEEVEEATEEEEEVEVDEMAMDLEDAVVSGGSAPMEEDDEEAEFEEAVAEAEAELEEEAAEAEAEAEVKVAEAEAEEEEEEEEEEVIEPEEEEEEEKPAVINAKAVVEAEEDEAEEEEEEVEEEAEEEEEGMEVEKRTIRGRPYWVDINTNKLYAVVGDDDVGDEVGAIVNGKPVFKAA